MLVTVQTFKEPLKQLELLEQQKNSNSTNFPGATRTFRATNTSNSTDVP